MLSSSGAYCSPCCRRVLIDPGLLTETGGFDQDSNPSAARRRNESLGGRVTAGRLRCTGVRMIALLSGVARRR